jgi:hypothetical protein
VVQDAIVKVLTSADDGMRLSEIHAKVERLLGHSVSKESVTWSLWSGSRGDQPRFERVRHGYYRNQRAV